MLKKNLIRITMLFLVSMPTVLATNKCGGSDSDMVPRKAPNSSPRSRLQRAKSVNDINSLSDSKLIQLVGVRQKDNGGTGTDYNTSRCLDGKNSDGALSGNGSDNVVVITNLCEKQDALDNEILPSRRVNSYPNLQKLGNMRDSQYRMPLPVGGNIDGNALDPSLSMDNRARSTSPFDLVRESSLRVGDLSQGLPGIGRIGFSPAQYALDNNNNFDEDDTKRELTSSPRFGGRNIDIDVDPRSMDDNGASSTLDRGGHLDLDPSRLNNVKFWNSWSLEKGRSLVVGNPGQNYLSRPNNRVQSLNISVPASHNKSNVGKSYKMPRNVLTFNDFIVMIAVAGIIVGAKWLYDKYYSPNKKERKNNRVSKNRTTKA